jgi:plasmid rolling circle replication initiator protein Rep
MPTKEMQVLHDVSSAGKVRPWYEKKEASTYLSYAYQEVNQRKAERVCECASMLMFRVSEGKPMRLHSMNSCRVKLCPMCQWRRSLKIAANVAKVIEGMKAEKDWAYIFLTLTVRNCTGADLKKTLDDMSEGWQRFSQRVMFKKAVKGYFKAIEVTHNVNPLSASYDTYHPHFHVLMAVNPSYFKKKEYIRHCLWNFLWRRSMRLDYIPIVDVRRVKGKKGGIIAEVAKYSVKEDEYLIKHDWDLTVETVKALDDALGDRRMISYGGKMSDWHKKLNLDDDEDGDLVNVGEEEETVAGEKELAFAWIGYNQTYNYYKTDVPAKPVTVECHE